MVDAQRAKREVKASSTTLLVHLLLVALQALVFFDSGQNFLCASRSGPDGPPAREIVTGSRRPVNVGVRLPNTSRTARARVWQG